MTLEELFNKYNCDKSRKHKYHEVYGPEWESIRNDEINFLEIGIFRGESARALLEYFPNANIYGIDIFTRITPESLGDLLNNPRFHWAKADSLITTAEEAFPGVKFDVVLDDGMHTPRANMLTFRNCIGSLKDDGAFYIEDVFPLDIMSETERKLPWLLSKPEEYNLARMEDFNNEISPYKTTHFDNRAKSNEPDSYVIKLEKVNEEA